VHLSVVLHILSCVERVDMRSVSSAGLAESLVAGSQTSQCNAATSTTQAKGDGIPIKCNNSHDTVK
jgi:hypothetical protein